jgi:hypothetical protein
MSSICSPSTTIRPGAGNDTLTDPATDRLTPWNVSIPSTWNRPVVPTGEASRSSTTARGWSRASTRRCSSAS